MEALDLGGLTRRSEAEAQLSARIAEPGVLQFLLKGLYRAEPARFAWRFNLPVLRRHLGDMTGSLPLGKLEMPALANLWHAVRLCAWAWTGGPQPPFHIAPIGLAGRGTLAACRTPRRIQIGR